MAERMALVTGVSGHVGRVLAERLQAAGLRVRALVRTPEQASLATRTGMEPWLGDLSAPRTLAGALTGAAIVVHAAAYLGPDRDLAEAVNVDGTRQLAEASLAAGSERFVHVSTMSVHGDPQPDGLTEESPLAADSDHPYVATKARAEVAVGEASSRGLRATVLRPGAICGALNSRWGDKLIARLREDGWPRSWHPGDVIPWVHADDLAEMTWLAATHPAAPGRTYLAVDRSVVIDDYVGPIAAALGCVITPPDRDQAISRCVIGRIRDELGYRPRGTFEHTLETLVELAAAGSAPRAACSLATAPRHSELTAKGQRAAKRRHDAGPGLGTAGPRR